MQVDLSELWLRAEMNRAFFPDESGHFQLLNADLVFDSVLTIEWPNLPLGQAQCVSVSSTAQWSGLRASATFNSPFYLLKL